jgi:flagellar biosynthesis/type III secretory pathway protein FliH
VNGSDAARTNGGGLASGARRIPAEAWDARQVARTLLAEAEDQARIILGAAGREAELARAAAVEAGFADGQATGLARAAAEVVRGAAERDRLLAGCSTELLDLAIELAERILGREVQPGLDGVAAAVRALAMVRGSPRVVLRASRDDVASLREGGVSSGSDPVGMRIVVDPELRAGEVVVEAEGAAVDGRFRTQLAELRRAVAEGEG